MGKHKVEKYNHKLCWLSDPDEYHPDSKNLTTLLTNTASKPATKWAWWHTGDNPGTVEAEAGASLWDRGWHCVPIKTLFQKKKKEKKWYIVWSKLKLEQKEIWQNYLWYLGPLWWGTVRRLKYQMGALEHKRTSEKSNGGEMPIIPQWKDCDPRQVALQVGTRPDRLHGKTLSQTSINLLPPEMYRGEKNPGKIQTQIA